MIYTNVQKRLVVEINPSLQFAAYLAADNFGIDGPRLKPKAQRMQDQNSFWLDLCPTARRCRHDGRQREEDNDSDAKTPRNDKGIRHKRIVTAKGLSNTTEGLQLLSLLHESGKRDRHAGLPG